MAANTTPIFGLNVRTSMGQLSVANTTNNGSGTITNIFSAGSNGSLITEVRIIATATTTAGRINLYVWDGATAVLWASVVVGAVTVAAGVKPWDYDVPMPGPLAYAAGAVVNPSVSLNGLQSNGLKLQSGYALRASTYNGETFNVIAGGIDY